MIYLEIVLWACIYAIAHTYVLYPMLLALYVMLKGAKNFDAYHKGDALPTVTLLMAAFNEEQVLERKIQSILNSEYPKENIEILIGSDNSTDRTNEILEHYSKSNKCIQISLFQTRRGKVQIINELREKAKGDILIVTDANVLLEENTIFETIKYFRDERVGLIDTHMTNYGIDRTGISFQETAYITREVSIKQLESRAFGTMIGPFGGCYAIRNDMFVPVPSNFIVDDFFICMSVLAKGKLAINNLKAIVHEDVSNNLQIEFKRKARIAMGNFQNLVYYRKLLWPPFKAVAFSFFSHKVLRWFGPFFLLVAFITNVFLFSYSVFYQVLLYMQLFITFLPIADFILKKIGIHVVLLRFATHFYTMNLSLLTGFIKSLKGVKTNVWKPTERFQA